jgi:hypothetical protein
MENGKFYSFINFYDIGYICEEHKKKNIDSCEMYNIDLYKICKPYHIHKISPKKHTKLDEKSLLNILQKKKHQMISIKDFN